MKGLELAESVQAGAGDPFARNPARALSHRRRGWDETGARQWQPEQQANAAAANLTVGVWPGSCPRRSVPSIRSSIANKLCKGRNWLDALPNLPLENQGLHGKLEVFGSSFTLALTTCAPFLA